MNKIAIAVKSIKKTPSKKPKPMVLPKKDDAKIIPMREDDELSDWQKVENFINKNYDLQYNEISNRVEYKKKDENEFRELKEANLFRDLKKARKNISMNNLMAMLSSDFVKTVNPFKSYFKSLPIWKEEDPDHIELLANYVKTKNPEDQKEFNHHFKKTLVRCVKCAIEDAYFNKHALILVGPTQSTGKTTFIRFLCPKILESYLSETITFNDKDNLIGLSENFIINMDELASLSKIEINSLKSYFSKDRIKVRHPYERRPTTTPRRVNFFGSTNKSEFLADETGTVRWLCFEIEYIDFKNPDKGNYTEKISIDSVWSQAYTLLKDGFKHELTPDEIVTNEIRNRLYQHTTTEIELIQKYFQIGTSKDHTHYFTADEIGDELKLCSQFGDYKKNLISIGKALSFLGFTKDCIRVDSTKTKKGYYVNYTATHDSSISEKKDSLPF